MSKEQAREGTNRPVYLQPLWCLGMVVVVLDACGDFVFIGLAPQSLLAPLGSLSLGWNIILAPIFHNEKVTKSILSATALIYVGTIVTVLFAPNISPTYNLAIIVDYILTIPVLLYFMFCISFQTFLVLNGRKRGYGIVHYCGLAGCFGGECLIFTKSTSELVKNAIITGDSTDFTTNPLPYFFIILMIFTVITQVNYLNKALAHFDALIVVPIFQSFWGIFSLTGGLIFFQEHKYMDALDGAMYGLGIFITMTGIVFLVRQRGASRDILYFAAENDSSHSDSSKHENEDSDDNDIEKDYESAHDKFSDIDDDSRKSKNHYETIIKCNDHEKSVNDLTKDCDSKSDDGDEEFYDPADEDTSTEDDIEKPQFPIELVDKDGTIDFLD